MTHYSHAGKHLRCERLEPRELLAVDTSLIADLNTFGLGSHAGDMHGHDDGWLYFSALEAGRSGTELWRSNGSQLQQVSDIGYGGRDVDPQHFASFRGELFFQADGGDDSAELWKFDGEDVTRVADIRPGDDEEGSYPTELTVWQDHLYFVATDQTGDRQLWRTNGQSVTRISDFDSVRVTDIVAMEDRLVVSVHQAATDSVWTFDGAALTPVPDFPPQEILPFGRSQIVSGLTVNRDQLFFTVAEVQSERFLQQQLWAYDGERSLPIADLPTRFDAAATETVWLQDTLYFAATTEEVGRELFRFTPQFDAAGGVQGGAVELVSDLNAGDEGAQPRSLFAHGDTLYFSADDGLLGRELWSLADDGPTLVADLNPRGDGTGVFEDTYFGVLNGLVHFTANDASIHNREVWQLSETGEARLFAETKSGTAHAGPQDLVEVGERVYFAYNPDPDTHERSLGILENDRPLPVVDPNGQLVGKHVSSLNSLGETVFFHAEDFSSRERQLWSYRSDQLVAVADAPTGTSYSVKYDGKLVFPVGEFRNFDKGLWIFDGNTFEQLQLPDGDVRSFYDVTTIGGKLYFKTTGEQIWRYDGSNVENVTALFPGEEIDLPNGLLVGTTLHVTLRGHSEAGKPDTGREYWQVDVETGESRLVRDFYLGGNYGNPDEYTWFDREVYFTVTAGRNGRTSRELWKIGDGEPVQVSNLIPDGYANPDYLTVLGNDLYFVASHTAFGRELFRYDGDRVWLAEDIFPGPTSSDPQIMPIERPGEIWIVAEHPQYGSELLRHQPQTHRDLNLDGQVDAADIDTLFAALRLGSEEGWYDINRDEFVDSADIVCFLDSLGTRLGDANLDGVFDSADLIAVFQAGEYDDSLVGNSRWRTGDWNADGEFDSADLVAALQNGYV